MGALTGLLHHMDWLSMLLFVMSGVACLICLTVHELSHGLAAYKLGDPTAKLEGRLTLNPLASVDPMGAAAILLFGFGWAKPVPVDSRYFKKPKQGMALVALAGPGYFSVSTEIPVEICHPIVTLSLQGGVGL